MEHLFENPKFWIAVAFVLLLGLLYKKVSALIASSLDSRSERIKNELDAARAIREEAEALLADYKQKQAHYVREAEQMLRDARKDADALVAHAQANAKATLDERMNAAMQRIAMEEEKALSEVRAQVVDMAMTAARGLVLQQMAGLPRDELVRLMLADVQQKLH